MPGVTKRTSVDGENVECRIEINDKQEKVVVEAYVPPDPGPYPQDQPKKNSVRFTPVQVCVIVF